MLQLTTAQYKQLIHETRNGKDIQVKHARIIESSIVRLILPMSPSANRYWRNYNGHVVVSNEASSYKANVGWIAKEAGITSPFDGNVAVSLYVYRKQRSGDLDNRIKVLLDSLNGIVFTDDSQVVEIHAYRRDDKINPRIEVEVRCMD